MSVNGYGQGVADQGTGHPSRKFDTHVERTNYEKGRDGK